MVVFVNTSNCLISLHISISTCFISAWAALVSNIHVQLIFISIWRMRMYARLSHKHIESVRHNCIQPHKTQFVHCSEQKARRKRTWKLIWILMEEGATANKMGAPEKCNLVNIHEHIFWLPVCPVCLCPCARVAANILLLQLLRTE